MNKEKEDNLKNISEKITIWKSDPKIEMEIRLGIISSTQKSLKNHISLQFISGVTKDDFQKILNLGWKQKEMPEILIDQYYSKDYRCRTSQSKGSYYEQISFDQQETFRTNGQSVYDIRIE